MDEEKETVGNGIWEGTFYLHGNQAEILFGMQTVSMWEDHYHIRWYRAAYLWKTKRISYTV